jgi:hypothetical protein
MLSVLFGGPYDGVSTNVQGAVFYPLLGTLGILILDNTRMRYSCLLLGLPCNRRRAKKNAVSSDGTFIYWVTRPSGFRVSMKLKRTIMRIEQTLR